jgi:hypothetical protein
MLGEAVDDFHNEMLLMQRIIQQNKYRVAHEIYILFYGKH